MQISRAIASFLIPPDARRDDHDPCRVCGVPSSDLSMSGTCPGCIDLHEQVAEETLDLWHHAEINPAYSRALLDLEHSNAAPSCGFISFEVRS